MISIIDSFPLFDIELKEEDLYERH